MYENLETTTCRLIRSDGEKWSVRELDLGATPPEVKAVSIYPGSGGQESVREFHLIRGDRIEWRRDDGSLAWATRIPLTTDPSSP